MGLFHKDQMTLQLEKYDYKPGDTIKGYVKLDLRKPLRCRKITVAFIGTRTDTVMVHSVNPKGIPTTQMQKIKTVIYNFEIPLDEENTYLTEMYPFEIKIPADILQGIDHKAQVQSIHLMGITVPLPLGGSQPLSTVIEWTVHGQLDVPLKIDVKADQHVVLSP